MPQIPMTPRSKRPSFFDEPAVDRLVTMMLEMMAELWVVKERIHKLEKVLSKAGVDVTGKIETCEFGADELMDLEMKRRKFVETIMRSLEDDFSDSAGLQADTGELAGEIK